MPFQVNIIETLNAYHDIEAFNPPEWPNELKLFHAIVEHAVAEAILYRDSEDRAGRRIVADLRKWASSSEDRLGSLVNCCDVLGLDVRHISRIILAILDSDVETLRSLHSKFGTKRCEAL